MDGLVTQAGMISAGAGWTPENLATLARWDSDGFEFSSDIYDLELAPDTTYSAVFVFQTTDTLMVFLGSTAQFALIAQPGNASTSQLNGLWGGITMDIDGVPITNGVTTRGTVSTLIATGTKILITIANFSNSSAANLILGGFASGGWRIVGTLHEMVAIRGAAAEEIALVQDFLTAKHGL